MTNFKLICMGNDNSELKTYLEQVDLESLALQNYLEKNNINWNDFMEKHLDTNKFCQWQKLVENQVMDGHIEPEG